MSVDSEYASTRSFSFSGTYSISSHRIHVECALLFGVHGIRLGEILLFEKGAYDV